MIKERIVPDSVKRRNGLDRLRVEIAQLLHQGAQGFCPVTNSGNELFMVGTPLPAKVINYLASRSVGLNNRHMLVLLKSGIHLGYQSAIKRTCGFTLVLSLEFFNARVSFGQVE